MLPVPKKGTMVALGPLPVTMPVEFPEMTSVPVALFASETVLTDVEGFRAPVPVLLLLMAVAVDEALSVSGRAEIVLRAVSVEIVLTATGVGRRAPVTVLETVIVLTGICVVVDTEAPPGTHDTPPILAMNDSSASNIKSEFALFGITTLYAEDSGIAGPDTVLHCPSTTVSEVML